jgi:hypothetical protein
LKESGEISRYGTINQFRLACPDTYVQDQLIDVHLAVIEQYVTAFFAPSTPPAPPPAPPATASPPTGP